MQLTGSGGEVRAGPRVAARLGDWSLGRGADAMHGGLLSVAAAVLERDRFWSEHGGAFDLLLVAGAARWIWRGVAVVWGRGAISINGIGKPEVRP